MKVTKYGHCCLLIEVAGKRILTDPGKFSSGFENITEIDLILITHEHADHFHSESVVHILEQNPQATVVTNSSVGALLAQMGISYECYEGDKAGECNGVHLHAIDGKHEEIYEEYGQVQNTGFLIEDTLFYPGDSYLVPQQPVEILALPVAGPWCKVPEAIRYALAVKPKIAFPVHDATLSELGKSVTYPHFERELKNIGCRFVVLDTNSPEEF